MLANPAKSSVLQTDRCSRYRGGSLRRPIPRWARWARCSRGRSSKLTLGSSVSSRAADWALRRVCGSWMGRRALLRAPDFEALFQAVPEPLVAALYRVHSTESIRRARAKGGSAAPEQFTSTANKATIRRASFATERLRRRRGDTTTCSRSTVACKESSPHAHCQGLGSPHKRWCQLFLRAYPRSTPPCSLVPPSLLRFVFRVFWRCSRFWFPALPRPKMRRRNP